MKPHTLLIATAILTAAALQAAGPKLETAPGPAAFAQLKNLVGDWQADTPMGKLRVNYQLIAGGTSLVAREMGENMPEMLTVFYLDGDRLLLTHYCMAGNQPRMQARAFNPETGEIDFQFLDATNLATPGATHMHNATIYLADRDHYHDAWQLYQEGRLNRTETFEFTRVK
ncbi:MAG TPA: hypothetical protein VMU80_15115 [Bryobacteraceae bacterium]|nr:hypothetical protein [Bryobacteraceae bacterium]